MTTELVKVEFPNIGETFNRALYNVLTMYFDGDSGGKAIANKTIIFPDCDIVFDLRFLTQQRTKPLIGIFGTIIRNQRNLKCEDVDELEEFGYQVRAETVRQVYVSVPKNPENDLENKRQADRIWDMLFVIFETQMQAWAERNIYTVKFPIAGREDPNPEYATLTGNLTCEVRANFVTRE